MTKTKATLIGLTAIAMWALLALFTIGSAPVPPLLLNALCFGIGGAIGLIWTITGAGLGVLKTVSWKVYAFGTLGLFGYHLLYFTAFRLSPTAETGLIAYLWPLFIVLLSGLLPGERLGALHIAGALMAFAGAALIVLARGGEAQGNSLGLALAFLCAVTWAVYSVLSRRLGTVPTESVTVFCLATAALSAVAHMAVGNNHLAAGRIGLGQRDSLGRGAGGGCVFHLGHRHEKRRHPTAWGRLVCGTVAFNLGAGGGGDCQAFKRHPDCGGFDHSRGGAGGKSKLCQSGQRQKGLRA